MKNLIKVTIRISSDPFGYAQGAHSATICMFGLCLLLLTVNFSTSVAQQLPMHSLFVMNDLLVNPAMAGKNDYNLVKTNVRYQWVEITTLAGSKIDAHSLSGDVGPKISAGKGKQIIWDMNKDNIDLQGREINVLVNGK